MVFSSLVFLFRFLPLALIAYYLTPRFMKNGVLFIISMIFYAWGEPRYMLIMLFSIVVDFTVSNLLERRDKVWQRRLILSVSLLANLGLLMTFKYLDFFIANLNLIPHLHLDYFSLTLPLGISFYTFQTMSYTLDVYRGKVAAEKNIINFACYVSLFPQLIAGPIVKYVDIKKELIQRKMDLGQISTGIRYFIMGMASKVLLANTLGLLWEDLALLGIDNISSPAAWLGLLAYGFQIYFDFSGYSLMAIGLGHMLGFHFPQNFNFPYMATSITDFWRRWHMTLGAWFREYVYIPLGGNRKGRRRQYVNILLVWFLTGFWHGANYNFIFWGLYFAGFLILEKRWWLGWLDKHPRLSHVYALLVVFLGWLIFAVPDLGQMGLYFTKLFSFDLGTDAVYILKNYGITFLLAGLFSTPWIKTLYQKHAQRTGLVALFLLFLFLLSTAYLVDSSFNPFLYFRF